MKYSNYIHSIITCTLAFLTGCIANDVLYPVIKAEIQEIELTGFVSSTIRKDTREVTVLVDDTIDLRKVTVTKLVVSDSAKVIPDEAACEDFINFPDTGFVSVDSLPGTANTRMDMSQPVQFVLHTYQDYPWKVTAKHDIKRIFKLRSVDGKDVQVSNPIVDESNRTVIVYVEKNTDLKNLVIEQLQLGSSVATTQPDPVTVTDFRRPREFTVTAFGQSETWIVSVTYFQGTLLTVTPWSRRAYISSVAKEGTAIDIKYRKEGETDWDQVFDDEITFSEDGNFYALLRHLSPATTYEYQATIGTQDFGLSSFTTDTVLQLPNSGFENWSEYKRDGVASKVAWAVHGEGEEMFWDTGNWGSVIGGVNVTLFEETDYHEGKRSARLKSENVVIKFAAGNLFAGKYIKTDGMDGELDFGRPFTVRPSALKGWFKYTSIPISSVGKLPSSIEDAQKGMNDKAIIYVAVGDWDSPVRIKTKTLELFDKDDPHIIAYQEMVIDKTVSNWTEFKLNLDYRSLTRKPTYLIVVASASKYGDYFTGGDGSTLWLDDFELIYE
ncbi:MAG: PCMD domain-containing protein [Parabacteroides sp.]|nr:PCMD domain-containing protein [Parabacteroides sp.]